MAPKSKYQKPNKMQPISISFQDLAITHQDKNRKRVIIDFISGDVIEGKVTALLGPSGAGKTTLLQLLAGRLPVSRRISVSGNIEPKPSPTRNSFVYQVDALCSYLTVRETLMFAAELRSNKSTSTTYHHYTSSKRAAVDNLIRKVGLVGVADSLVGDDNKVRGVSGGERKRVSIASELLGDPLALFLDEPTSGLDSYQAQKVMESLCEDNETATATTSTTVVLSMHQPSAYLLQYCDYVALLGATGGLLYMGLPSELGPYLTSKTKSLDGVLTRPPLSSDFEFALMVASIDHSTGEESIEESKERLVELRRAWKEQYEDQRSSLESLSSESSLNAEAGGTSSLDMMFYNGLRKWRWLLWRAFKLAGASPKLILIRLFANFATALIFGSIFYALPRTNVSILGRKGLCNVVCNFAAMTSMVKTLGVFRTETLMIERERGAKLYSVFSFYSAKVLAELPLSVLLISVLGFTTSYLTHHTSAYLLTQHINFVVLVGLLWQVGSALGLLLGVLMPSVDAALELGKMITMVSIIFGGLYFDVKTLPWFLQWLPLISPVKRCWEGMVMNEFKMIEFEDFGKSDGGERNFKHGSEVLMELGLNEGSGHTPWNSMVLLMQTAGLLHLCAFLILVLKSPKYAKP